MPTLPINLIIVDDDPIVQRALTFLLPSDNINIVAYAREAKESLNLLDKMSLSTLEKTIILIDVQLHSSDGIVLAEMILRRASAVKILIFTVGIDSERVDYLLSIGIKGVFLKENSLLLAQAIHDIADDKFVIPEKLREQLRFDYLKKQKIRKPGVLRLSPRENQIITLMCAGHNNEEIAQLMGIDLESIYYAKYNARKKLGLKNDVQLGRIYANYFNDKQKY